MRTAVSRRKRLTAGPSLRTTRATPAAAPLPPAPVEDHVQTYPQFQRTTARAPMGTPEVQLTALDESVLPGQPVRALVQIQWPLGGQAVSPHNDKSVTVVRCHASLLGWVRMNPKHGRMVPTPAGERPVSALLEKHYQAELQSGSVVQIFDSGPQPVRAPM